MIRQFPSAPPGLEDFGAAGNLAAALNSTFEYDNQFGFSTIAFRLKVPTGGKVAFEGSFDGTTWVAITLRSIDTDEFLQVASADDTFIGSISSTRKFRVRTSTAGSAAGDVIGRTTMDVAMLEGQEFLPPPHKFGQTPIHKDKTITAAVTGLAIWTPAAGKKFVVTDLYIAASNMADMNLSIFDEADVEGKRLFKGLLDLSVNNGINLPISLKTPFVSSAANNSLRATSSVNVTECNVITHGYEVL